MLGSEIQSPVRSAVLLVALGFSMLGTCSQAHSAGPQAKERLSGKGVVETDDVFKGSFGEQFRYTSPMTILYNPHGSADRALFLWEEKLIGGMILYPLPPEASEEDMKAVIIKGLKSDQKGTSITYTKFKNRTGCEFRKATCHVELNNEQLIYFLFMFIDTRTLANPEQDRLRQAFGTYKFDFVIPRSKSATLRKQIGDIIDTFTPPVDLSAK